MHRPDGSEWLWLADDGHRLAADSITSMVERLKRKGGVASGGLCHRFRHYFATRYLEAGGNMNSLRLLLGHESYDMVLHYTRMVSARRAINEHADFSPLDHLYRGSNHNHDGWGYRH